ncbi:type IV pilus assembly PilZ [Oleiphilus messinensis]|uniref:Type IV pilus assembly PilZ n=1 Tax=Oleiphilus messinensis TaxID=141451 RepID=A0A1Y0IBH2_9GAMM|nr:PilZ domain-containing protein [Oleiphilus messinensis]ARU57116.1 type IV pilus assembly PilZ [Oleiphilus messinensis]
MREEEQGSAGDRRNHNRTSFNARVKIMHKDLGEVLCNTRDISDGGVFVLISAEQKFPKLGSLVRVQVQGLPVEAPILDMVVVRKGVDGYGLHFLNNYE